MASWDDDDFDFDAVPKIPGGVAGNWDDEDQDLHTEEPGPSGPKKPVQIKPKHLAKMKREEQSARDRRDAEAAARRMREIETPLDDPVEERKRLERMQVQSELEIAEDTFGAASANVEVPEDDMTAAIHAIPLPNAGAFTTAAQKLAERLYSVPPELSGPAARRAAAAAKINATTFITELIRSSFGELSVDDINDLVKLLNTERNAKIEAAKPKKKGKAKQFKGKQGFARVQRDDDFMTDTADLGTEYDDFM